MIRYYQTDKGYVATDSSVRLRANDSSVGNAVVFGRGPTVGWDISSITDQVFVPKSLGVEVEADSVPQEWQDALGLATVKSPVKTGGLSHSSGLPDLTKQDAEQDRGPDQVARFLMFAAGVFVGLVLAYYFTI
ncbi:MAG: hypothetical protein WC315_00455 [Candidatus Omnitrophota bacterium]|jgi:hypothetical protein